MYFSQNIKFNKIQIFIVTLLYSILPISYISGSFFINLNFILIDLAFIYVLLKTKNFPYKEFKNEFFIIFSIFLYILLNSIIQYSYYNGYISINDEGFIRSIGLIKYVIFYFASIYFFQIIGSNKNKIFDTWSLVLLVIIIDVFFERINGHNLINITSPSSERIASFFGDELIVGYFILSFGFISLIHFLQKINLKKKFLHQILLCFFIILIPLTILLTGERSNFLKSIFICFVILIALSKYKKIINLKYFSILISAILLLTFVSSDNLKNRYLTTFNELINSYQDKDKKIFITTKHFYNYKLGYNIFKENIFFGVSTKKFRFVCKQKKDLSEQMVSFGCSTHPHQTYIDLLSEHGIFGFSLIFISFFLFIVKRCKEFFENINFIQLSAIAFIVSLWIPFLPFGSFFSTSAFSLIIINLVIARCIKS